MKKLNLYDIFLLGKKVGRVGEINWRSPRKEMIFPLWELRNALQEASGPDSPVLEATKRAINKAIAAIGDFLPLDLQGFNFEEEGELGYAGYHIGESLTALESVLANEMPGVPSYIVSQKGIYRTEDLIDRAHNHFPSGISSELALQAKIDLCEAGKCLAFELPTACSFHLWRALETVIDAYYARLTSSDFATDKVQQNWGAKIKALEARDADKAITKYLDHIRDHYRNPQTHPEETVQLDEALMLFGTAASSITQMMLAIRKLKEAKLGLADALVGISLLDAAQNTG